MFSLQSHYHCMLKIKLCFKLYWVIFFVVTAVLSCNQILLVQPFLILTDKAMGSC